MRSMRAAFEPSFSRLSDGAGGSIKPATLVSATTSVSVDNASRAAVSIPSGAIDDLIVVGVFYSAGATYSAPTGWTDVTPSSDAVVAQFFIRRADGTEGATENFSFSPTGSSGYRTRALAFRIRNGHFIYQNYGSAVTNPVFPALSSAVVPGSGLILGVIRASTGDANTYSVPDGSPPVTEGNRWSLFAWPMEAGAVSSVTATRLTGSSNGYPYHFPVPTIIR